MAKRSMSAPVAAPPEPEPMLSTRDVARRYGVSEETVRRWCRKGIIPYKQIGPFRLRRICASALMAFESAGHANP